ncbi:hypothetical protein DID77_04890, partial [Candidatus Marinamargulisbacteria bacterium SCGC AG-439-L15]
NGSFSKEQIYPKPSSLKPEHKDSKLGAPQKRQNPFKRFFYGKKDAAKRDKFLEKEKINRLMKRSDISAIEKLFIMEKDRSDYDPKLDVENNISSEEFLPTQNLETEIDSPSVIDLHKLSLDEADDDYLKQFGYDVFESNQSISFSVLDTPVGPDYMLGPGDRLVINVWGKVQQSVEAVLNKNGAIYWPELGYIYLSGVKFGNVTKIIKKKLGQKYVNFDVSVAMKQIRNIRVYVLGDVMRPGSYEITSLGTVFHALYASGGPKKNGTLRKVQLIRGKNKRYTIDLYKYLVYGDRTQDFSLRPNDTIFIPSIGGVAKIDGAVIRPAIYELSKKTTLYDLIQLAGGLTAKSYGGRIRITRVRTGLREQVYDLKFDSIETLLKKSKAYEVRNGDDVMIFPITKRLHHFVKLQGNVQREGEYGFWEGMTVSDLVKQGEGVLEETYLKKVDVYRFIAKNKREMISVDFSSLEGRSFPLQERDVVRVFSKDEVLGQGYVVLDGEVEEPGTYRLMKNMKISDLIFMAKLKTFAEKENVEVFRKTESNQQFIYKINLKKIIENPSSTQNIYLQDKDRIFIRENSLYIKKRYITLKGEVRFPGTYVARAGERLASIIDRAGGFTTDAFIGGAIFSRESIKQQELVGQTKILNDEKKRLIYDKKHLSTMSQDAVVANQVVMESREKALDDLKKRLGRSNGRIVLSLRNGSLFKSSKSNIQVENGDVLEIPQIPESVQLIGGVENPTSILFVPNKKAHYYIKQVGGFTDYANKKRILIFKPNGLVRTNNPVIQRGDTIYIPEKIRIDVNWLKFITNIADILAKAATGLAAIKVLQGD